MAPARTIDSFFKKASAPVPPTNTKKNKRSRDSSDTPEEPVATKKAKTTTKPKAAPKSKLKKSTTPTWTGSNYNSTAPTGPNAKKCIEKWNLLAPYDTSITEQQWGEYYEERLALEKTNTEGTEEYKRIKSEELMQNTARLLRDARDKIAQAILGSCLESSERVQIAKTIKGSLYYLDLWGNEEDGGGSDEDGGRKSFSPMTVLLDTTILSLWAGNLLMCSRSASDCNKAKPYECAAQMGGRGSIGPPIEGSVRLFNWSGAKSTGTTAANMSDLENTLFACSGWLSPRLMFNLLCAGGTATLYQESPTSHVYSAQTKFKLFDGEKEGAEPEEEE